MFLQNSVKISKSKERTYRSGLLKVVAGAVVGLDEALPAVEERRHEHAQGEEVAGHAAHRLVLRLGSCEKEREERIIRVLETLGRHFSHNPSGKGAIMGLG